MLREIPSSNQRHQTEERHIGPKRDKEDKLSDQQVLKLHDSTIAQIVRLIQLGILTGTDISDQLRTLECVVTDDKLIPNPDYMEFFEKNLQSLQDSIPDLES